MKNIKRFVSVIVVSAVAVFTASAKMENSQHPLLKYMKELDLPTVYSGDMSTTVMGITTATKVYQDGDSSRTETVIPVLNTKIVTIATTKDGEPIAYMLFPASKKYVVQKPDANSGVADESEIVMADLGTEEFNGEKCNKKRLTKKGEDSTVWDILFSPKQKNMPVKITAEVDGENAVVVMTFTDYVFKKPDAALFTVPADYTEAETMEEAMAGSGGLFGMLSAMAAAAEDQETEEEKAAKKKAEEEAKREAIEAAKKEAADAAKDAAKDEAKGAIRRGIRGLF